MTTVKKYDVPAGLNVEALPEYKDVEVIKPDTWAKHTWNSPSSKPSLVRILSMQQRGSDWYVRYIFVSATTGHTGANPIDVTIGRKYNTWAVLSIDRVDN